jgi:hypothetical protein
VDTWLFLAPDGALTVEGFLEVLGEAGPLPDFPVLAGFGWLLVRLVWADLVWLVVIVVLAGRGRLADGVGLVEDL